jgi:hypothetical protein
MFDKDVMVLQGHYNSEMAVGNPCGETNPTAPDASEAIGVKVEEVSAAEEEAGPVPITFRTIKTEPEVSCMSLYVHCRPQGL